MKSQTDTLERPVLGIMFFSLAVLLQAVMEGFVKWVSKDYPVGQIVFYRSLFAFPPILLFVWIAGDKLFSPPQNIIGLLARGLAMVLTMAMFFEALEWIPLAEATAVFFTAPLFMVLLAAIFFKEKLDTWLVLSVFLGLVGAALILKPDLGSLGYKSLLPLLASLTYAIVMIITRYLHKTDTSTNILILGNLVVLILSGCSMFIGYSELQSDDLIVFIILGTCGGFSVAFFAQSLKIASVGTVAPFEYTALFWAVIFGYIFWNEVPTVLAIVGATLIVISTVVLSIIRK